MNHAGTSRRLRRNAMVGAVALILFLALAIAPSSVYAALASALAGKVDVDPGYVTGASQVTDIAFAPDGRAVITQKGGQVRIGRSDGGARSTHLCLGPAQPMARVGRSGDRFPVDR